MSSKGFIESLLDSFSLWAAVQDSKDSNGKPDPYKAAGIAFGMRGDLSTADILELGGYLGAEGAFDSNGSVDSADDDYDPMLTPVQERQSMDWNAISEEEKQRRILKAQHTKAQYRYWQALWEYKELVTNLPPVELAEGVWKEIIEKENESDAPDPELRSKFTKWLRKNHDIRMDAEGNMHLIRRKDKNEE